jgi:hypothetical protein
MGPSGSSGSGARPGSDGLGDDGEVTAVISATVGACHFCVVTMLAVAVSFTDLTEVAPGATAIWACRTTGLFTGTGPTVHAAVPSPLAQPLVNVALRLVGCAASATDTPEADAFRVETRTMKAAWCPRVTLAWERWTLTHSSGCAVALASGLAAMYASSEALATALVTVLAGGAGGPVSVGEPDGDGSAVGEGEGKLGLGLGLGPGRLGPGLGLPVAAAALGEPLGEEAMPSGNEGGPFLIEGSGEGDGEAVPGGTGSAWH